jgi:hypothetical protein
MLRELDFSIGSVTSRPLTFSIAGKFPYFRCVFLHTYRTQSSSCLHIIRSLKMSPAHFVWLIATALIIASIRIDTALIIFYYTFSLPYCNSQGLHFSQYSMWNKSFLTLKYYVLKLFHTSSTHPPLPAHIANLPRRNVCSPIVSALWYTGSSLSTTGRQNFSSHSTSNNTPQWSLTPSITLQEVNKLSGRTKYTSSNASPRVGFFTTCVYPLSHKQTNKQTPWPSVRKRTIPTDRPPLVDEI